MPHGRPLRPRPRLAIYIVQKAVKYNAVSLRHKHSLEILFIHRNQCKYQVLVRQPFHSKTFFVNKNFIFENFIFFPKILSHFILFYFILFY